jgi:hypothetical protein
MTLYTGGRYGVSPPCELSNVSANEMIGKTTFYIGSSCRVFHQCELLYVRANKLIVKMTLYTEGR